MPLHLRSHLDVAIIFILVLAIYLLFPTTNYYWDGLIYGEFLEKADGFGAHLFHPNHLLYNFVGFFALHAARLVSPLVRALHSLQYLTILFGAGSVAIFYLIAKRVYSSQRIVLVSTVIFAFSAGWWRFATDADVYVISIAFLLLSFLAAFALEKPRPITAGIAFAAAMLFHQLAIFFLPALFLALLYRDGRRERSNLKNAVAACSVAFSIVAVAYLSGYYLTNDGYTIAGFFDWITQRAEVSKKAVPVTESLYWLGGGTRRLFIDGSSKLLSERPISILSLVAFAILAAGLIVSLITSHRTSSTPNEATIAPQPPVRPLAWWGVFLIWIVPYVLFLLFVMPANTFYRLFYFPPMVLLLGEMLSKVEFLNRRRHTLPLLAAAFAVYNFAFYIYPNSYVREESVLAAAIRANAVWSGKTRIIYDPAERLDGSHRLLAYFNPDTRWIRFDSLTPDQKAVLLDGRPDADDVWIESSLEARDPSLLQLTADTSEMNVIAAPRYDIRFVKLRTAED